MLQSRECPPGCKAQKQPHPSPLRAGIGDQGDSLLSCWSAGYSILEQITPSNGISKRMRVLRSLAVNLPRGQGVHPRTDNFSVAQAEHRSGQPRGGKRRCRETSDAERSKPASLARFSPVPGCDEASLGTPKYRQGVITAHGVTHPCACPAVPV